MFFFILILYTLLIVISPTNIDRAAYYCLLFLYTQQTNAIKDEATTSHLSLFPYFKETLYQKTNLSLREAFYLKIFT